MIGPLPDGPCMHLDRGYDSRKTCDLMQILGYDDDIAVKGQPAPIQAGKRWPVERLHSWMNGYGKLRRFTDKRKVIVGFCLNCPLAHALFGIQFDGFEAFYGLTALFRRLGLAAAIGVTLPATSFESAAAMTRSRSWAACW